MVDVNKPVENPELVSSIECLQENPSRETEAALFECLKAANFLMILHGGLKHSEPDADGKITLTQGTIISFPMLTDANGRQLHFGFTDWPSLYAWNNQPDQQSLIVPFSDLPSMILRDDFECAGFLINPSTHNFFIPRDILARLSGKTQPYVIKEDTKVLLGEPRNYPHELVASVKTRLKTIREVKKAWLFLMVKEDEQSFLIILEHTGDRSKISQAVADAAKNYLTDGMLLDITTTDQSFGENATKNKKPFYKRSLFG